MNQLQILYQDDYLICVDKPSGMLSVPGKTADKQHCVLSVLEEAQMPVMVVHRLDRDTSGVILFALNQKIQSLLNNSFAKRKIRKRYQAIVVGHVAEKSGTIDLSLRKDMQSSLPPRYIVDQQSGKHAKTVWKILARLDGTTRLDLQPKTGRSHQLRVHCSAIGHPILGDPIYGTSEPKDRLMLHACELTFQHPCNDVILTVESPCPF